MAFFQTLGQLTLNKDTICLSQEVTMSKGLNWQFHCITGKCTQQVIKMLGHVYSVVGISQQISPNN